MNTFFTFINAILIISALQGFVLGILLLKRKDNKTSNKILSCLLGIFSCSIIIHVVSHSGILPFFDFHKIIIGILFIIAAPLIYFYVKSLTVAGFRFSNKDKLHLLPLILTVMLAVLILLDKSSFMYYFMKEVILSLSFVSIIVYIVLANYVLYRFGKMLVQNYSNIEKINLRWLRIFIFSFTVIWIFAGILEIYYYNVDWDIVWILCSFIIFITGYFGFHQPEIFSTGVHNLEDEKKNAKYEKSALNSEMAESYAKKLQSLMDEKKLFLESGISLSSLAENVGISVHHLSQILNEQLGLTFYDYINSKRIEAAKEMLIDQKFANQSISAIAFEVGYNSLSAFNSAFKKFTDRTPSQFRKEPK